MGSRRGTLGSQQERREASRARLVEATVALIGEQGLLGFSVSEVGERAGVGRALAGYHFKTSRALLLEAASSLLAGAAGAAERGLEPMLRWIEGQLQRAASRDPRLLAVLQVAVGPGGFTVQDQRTQYWRQATELLRRHLASAQALQQIRPDLDPAGTASILLGMLHGEQLRIIAAVQTADPAFIDLIERALVMAAAAKAPRKPAKAKEVAAPDLFGSP